MTKNNSCKIKKILVLYKKDFFILETYKFFYKLVTILIFLSFLIYFNIN